MPCNAHALSRVSALWFGLAIACLMQAANASEPQFLVPNASDTFFRSSFENGETLPCQAAQDTDHDGLLDPVCIETFAPPDPVSVAPPIDPTVTSDFWTINQFLIQPPNAVQREAVSERFQPFRAAIMRGFVRDELGAPLPGVLIRILDHPEYGYTFSRTDGGYDMLVNGGGDVLLDFQKTGFLRAQRIEHTAWKDWTILEDVHLLPYDAASTQVFFGAASGQQVHRATPVVDSDGTRQSTIIVPAGTDASLRRLDGTTVVTPTLRLRATEYTVGEFGPKRMPATLPETSGYTYAVELSADEAIAAGARSVEFSQPLALYFENYLDFPVGEVVPVGYYDYVYGSWLPSDNGRVIKVLGIAGGIASLDIDGSATPASAAMLAELGITLAEQTRLATLYPVGEELWRTPIEHLTPFDCNQPWMPVQPAPPPPTDPEPDSNPPTAPDNDPGDDQEEPPPVEPDSDPDDSSDDEKKPECESGSVIECENARLREYIPIQGTPISLAYQSARMPGGSISSLTTRVKLTPSDLPPTVRRVELDLVVGGKQHRFVFDPPLANQSHDFTFDRQDVYGRELQGEGQRFTARVTYAYDAVYTRAPGPTESPQSWAGMTGDIAESWASNREYLLSRSWSSPGTTLKARFKRRGAWDARGLSNGGWSFSEHHVYDPERRIVLKGDGSMRSADVQSSTEVALTFPYAPASAGQLVGPDASVWLIWHGIDPGGTRGPTVPLRTTISRTLPGGQPEQMAESCPPDAQDGNFCASGFTPSFEINDAHFVYVVDELGNLYFAGGRALYKLDVATRTVRLLRDSALADDPCVYAHLKWHDRRIYHSCEEGGIGMVWPNGSATPLARGGTNDGENIAVQDANLYAPRWLDVDAQGNVLFVESTQPRLRKLGIDGRVTTIAGNGTLGVPVDGAMAADSPLPYVGSVDAAADGSYYILAGEHVFQVRSSGQVFTILGGGNEQFDPTRVQRARSIGVSSEGFVKSMPDGGLIYGKSYLQPGALVRIGGGSFRFDAEGGQHQIPSEDGKRYWVFSASGRHLETRNTVTGGLIFKFNYNTAGRLVGVQDGDGDLTSIERDGNGRATAIQSADGHRTVLSYAPSGLLSQVDSVENRTWKLQYDPDIAKFGLLSRFEDPRGFASTMEWAVTGRLTLDTNAEGGFTRLFRSLWNTLDAERTTLQTAEGRQRYVWSNNSPGRVFRHAQAFSGAFATSNESATHASFDIHDDGSISSTTRRGDDRFGYSVPIASSVLKLPQPAPDLSIYRAQFSFASALGTQLGQRDLQYQTIVNSRQYLRNYDALSRTWVTRSPMARETSVLVDAQERPLQVSIPGLNIVNYQYDARGRLQTITSGSGIEQRQWQFGYDSKGYLDTLTDPMLRTTTLTNDNAGRTVQQTLPDSRHIGFSYDQNSNITAITPSGRPDHTFVYNKVNRVTEYQPPTVPGISDATTDYRYNLDQIVTGQTRQGSTQITPILETGTLLVKHLDTPHGRYTFSRFGSGNERITHFTHANTDVLRQFNGPLLRQEQTYIDGYDGFSWDATINYLHNANHWLDGMGILTNNNATNETTAVSVDYNYDADGLLTQAVVDSGSNLIFFRNAQNGLLTGTQMGSIVDSWQYNGFAEPVEYRADYSGSDLLHEVYTRDKLGRITQKVETVGAATTTTVYGYDLAGRLDTVTENGVLIADYSYDSNSNRVGAALAATGIASTGCAAGMPSPAATVDAQDRLQSFGNCTYAHTANGELTSKTNTATSQTTTYDYDVFANLRSATLPNGDVLSYQIDGRNRRIGKSVNGVKVQGLVYMNQLEPVAETDGAGNRLATFIYADRSNVPSMLMKGGNSYRIIADHLGSVRLVVDTADGTVVQRMDYDAWGNVTNDTNPGFQPFGYAGGIYDRDLKLVRFGARDYDPEGGRWTVKDPLGLRAGDTNVFRYAAGDPINLLDMNGLAPGAAFRTCTSAAWDALNTINARSISENREYGGLIFEKDGKFYATEPVVGSEQDVRPGSTMSDVPEGAKYCGDYHTHGDYSKYDEAGKVVRTDAANDAFDSDNFSQADKITSDSLDKPGLPPWNSYLGTPNGSFLHYSGGDVATVKNAFY